MAATQQPRSTQWMSLPQNMEGVPPGLEYLTMVDHLLITQQVEMVEAFTGLETNNRYEITNSVGQRVYYAAEDTCCCTRNCCGPSRPFEIKILDNRGQEVIHLHRPLRCDSCWFFCCLQKVEISSPVGQVIGYVRQAWSVCFPKFYVEDASGKTIFIIEGPLLTCAMCGDVEFQVLTKDRKMQVGKISKQFSGLVKELFTDADNFGMAFPMDLDVKMKACLLGAVFLIDFMFYEKKDNKEEFKVGMA